VVISAMRPPPVRSTSSLNGRKVSPPARRRYEAAAGIRLAAVGSSRQSPKIAAS